MNNDYEELIKKIDKVRDDIRYTAILLMIAIGAATGMILLSTRGIYLLCK